MKNTRSTVFVLATALTLSVLLATGCRGGAEERAAFAQSMTAPAEGLTASTSGTANKILVIHLPGTTLSRSANLIREERLASLRSKGFKRVEVRGSDGNLLWERALD